MRYWQYSFIVAAFLAMLFTLSCGRAGEPELPEATPPSEERPPGQLSPPDPEWQELIQKWLEWEEGQQTREYYLQQAQRYEDIAAELELLEADDDLGVWEGGKEDWASYCRRKAQHYLRWADAIPHPVTLEQEAQAAKEFEAWLAQQGTQEQQRQYLLRQQERGDYLQLALRYEEMAGAYEALGDAIEENQPLVYAEYFDVLGILFEEGHSVEEAEECYQLAGQYREMAIHYRSLRDEIPVVIEGDIPEARQVF